MSRLIYIFIFCFVLLARAAEDPNDSYDFQTRCPKEGAIAEASFEEEKGSGTFLIKSWYTGTINKTFFAMARIPRAAAPDIVYHVLNRANGRDRIFQKEKDYIAFEKILLEGKEKFDMRILAFCVMPNHWHLILYPKIGEDLSLFMRWITHHILLHSDPLERLQLR